jgi:glucose-1-phosphate thymidylyltransferase
LIISTPQDLPSFERLLGDGSEIGVKFSYAVQPEPEGLAQAFLIGEEFINGDKCALVLGDNIFYGHGLGEMVTNAASLDTGAEIFGYQVAEPGRYGVIEFGDQGQVLSIEEKPENPKSNYVATGLYFYDETVVERAKRVKRSARGELEITSLNEDYLSDGLLRANVLERGFAWFDTGTHTSLLNASLFVKSIEDRQGLRVACLEEIAYRLGYINQSQLQELAKPLLKTGYGRYLQQIAAG